MSETSSLELGAKEGLGVASWHVRAAAQTDAVTVAAAVNELLAELGGEPPAVTELEKAVRALIDDRDAGALLVAEHAEEVVGVLGASWQTAVRIPGRYGLIQELWVHPAWRGQEIGADLLRALVEVARKQGVERIEVGLPSERFPHLEATEAFYVNCGFKAIGTRMRRLL
jgi:GNAT superfamily N-acetyltransferase